MRLRRKPIGQGANMVQQISHYPGNAGRLNDMGELRWQPFKGAPHDAVRSVIVPKSGSRIGPVCRLRFENAPTHSIGREKRNRSRSTTTTDYLAHRRDIAWQMRSSATAAMFCPPNCAMPGNVSTSNSNVGKTSWAMFSSMKSRQDRSRVPEMS